MGNSTPGHGGGKTDAVETARSNTFVSKNLIIGLGLCLIAACAFAIQRKCTVGREAAGGASDRAVHP